MILTHNRISESTWSVPLAALVLVGMLLAFYSVVSNAAEAGERRRHATATQAAAVMRCNALPGWVLGQACRKDIATQADGQATLVLAAQ